MKAHDLLNLGHPHRCHPGDRHSVRLVAESVISYVELTGASGANHAGLTCDFVLRRFKGNTHGVQRFIAIIGERVVDDISLSLGLNRSQRLQLPLLQLYLQCLKSLGALIGAMRDPQGPPCDSDTDSGDQIREVHAPNPIHPKKNAPAVAAAEA